MTADELFHWIMDSYFGHNICDGLKLVKNIFMMDLFLTNTGFSLHKMLTDGLEWCGLLVDYCDVFISCWTLILTAPIHCRGSTGEQVM